MGVGPEGVAGDEFLERVAGPGELAGQPGRDAQNQQRLGVIRDDQEDFLGLAFGHRRAGLKEADRVGEGGR
jgi:hypothetical protein